MDTGLRLEVKLTLPDVVQSFHVQHLPHPHSDISASSIIMSDQWGGDATEYQQTAKFQYSVGFSRAIKHVIKGEGTTRK